MKMTWTILLVCCSYFVFLAPNVLLSVFDYDASQQGTFFQHLSVCLLWCQYSVNQFIYAASNKHYRSETALQRSFGALIMIPTAKIGLTALPIIAFTIVLQYRTRIGCFEV